MKPYYTRKEFEKIFYEDTGLFIKKEHFRNIGRQTAAYFLNNGTFI